MESWAHEGVCDEDVDSSEVIIAEGFDVEDDLVENAICETPHVSCQVRRHVREEGTLRCSQHRSCVERDHYELRAMLERVAKETRKFVYI
jgi:hypothetical protein